jgi:EAL and modified HD-GYP domain-containing signal transduction protein
MAQAASSTSGGQVFLARAPISTRQHRVLGYQIRVGRRTGAPVGDPAAATDACQVGRILGSVGTETLTQNRLAFLRVTRQDLLGSIVRELPAKSVVFELSGDIQVDSAVKSACADLRTRGYRLAIDDFMLASPASDLAPYADYLSIDVSDARLAETRARTVACFRQSPTTLIAKGVETIEQAEAAAQDGFVCFQGFFFGRPMLLPGRQISPQQITALRLLRALNDPNLSLGEIEDLVKHDATLCYRILRAVNSAAYATRGTVSSMREALLLLGRDMVRRWASLWAVASLGVTADSELVIMSTLRGRLCELLAASAYNEEASGQAFLLGICSLLDTIVGRPMAEIVAELPLTDETRRALCGESTPARDLLDCVLAYERGAWDECETIARRARVNPAVLPGAFLEALRWVREFHEPQAPSSRPS